MNDETKRILVIDDNEAIHNDFQKIFNKFDDNSIVELDELAAELFGDEVSNDSSNMAQTRIKLNFASQGKEGFEMLKEAKQRGNPFEMAFVDMRMPPGWDGVETIVKLWEVDPNLQIVICTAYSDRSWDQIFSELGETDKVLILKKPFEAIEVTQMAVSLCEKRRLLNELQEKLTKRENGTCNA